MNHFIGNILTILVIAISCIPMGSVQPKKTAYQNCVDELGRSFGLNSTPDDWIVFAIQNLTHRMQFDENIKMFYASLNNKGDPKNIDIPDVYCAGVVSHISDEGEKNRIKDDCKRYLGGDRTNKDKILFEALFYYCMTDWVTGELCPGPKYMHDYLLHISNVVKIKTESLEDMEKPEQFCTRHHGKPEESVTFKDQASTSSGQFRGIN